MKTQNKAFTLVELIVVITILAILGTIAFISMQGYSKSSRDSVRISDMSKIKSSLELFHIGAGKYPNTTDPTDITYSGAVIRYQGTFGESTYTNVAKLDKIPLDPLTEKEYTYSVVNTKQEYEIAGIMEGDDVALNDEILNEANAGDKIATAYVTGHYNGKIAKVFTDGDTFVLAVPTIISGSGITIEEIMSLQSFVYTGFKNLPFNYEGSSYNTLGEIGGLPLVNPAAYVVYSGSLANLTGDNPQYRVDMLSALSAAYTGTLITDNSAINDILAITDFTVENPDAVNLSGLIVNTSLGGDVTNVQATIGTCIFGTSVFGYCTF